MSIIHVESDFAIIDEQQFHNEIFREIGIKMRPELFQITSKFMPDSQFEAIQKRGVTDKKRRKRRLLDTSEDVKSIQKLAERIQKAGEEKGYFQKTDTKDNNKLARESAKKALEVCLPHPTTSSEQIVDISDFSNIEKPEKIDNLLCNGLISNWIRNPGNSPKILENSENFQFFVPPEATFHIGDVRNVEQFVRIHDTPFDLIIADPPWFSHSVKRKKTYEMNESCLDDLNLPLISTPNALIIFWMTSRKGIEEEMNGRFDTWNMRVVGRWKWLKVTLEGETVGEFDNEQHKLPFETLVLAMRKGAEPVDTLPQKFTFASIPMSVHSHKPPLLDLLRHFRVPFSNPLELFARSLLPATHSIGFEPLLLQSERVFQFQFQK